MDSCSVDTVKYGATIISLVNNTSNNSRIKFGSEIIFSPGVSQDPHS